MSMAAIIGAFPDDDDDHRRKPPAPKTPPPRPSGADIARDLVKDVKDPVSDTEDALQR
jgi:hypothetical protein